MLVTEPLVIDINRHIEWEERKPSFKQLLDTPDLKLVMIRMRREHAVAWHRSSVAITVFVHQGEIDFGVRDSGEEQVYRLSQGMSITLPAGLDHQLAALQDSVVLVYKTPNPEKPCQFTNRTQEVSAMIQQNGGCMGHVGGAKTQASYCAAIQQLFNEHPPLRQQMEQLVQKAQQLAESADEQAAAAIQQLVGWEGHFRRELEIHSEKEEQGLFPLLGRHIGTETGPIAVMEYEHSEAKRMLAEFERQAGQPEGPWTPERLQAVTAPLVRGCQILFEHFLKEENVLFPMAETILSQQEKEELLRIVEAKR
ncbi:hemerythrin domain-containing protein [Effusibacillus pohliae]|uniref:hemerythrin domain-containing protein n=1 Tax=Effusibacillus pohliae TaxID=232270 RepID=UPI0003773978|nr:hemerythrin domain-containing protein [Effusibacillus pohliae]